MTYAPHFIDLRHAGVSRVKGKGVAHETENRPRQARQPAQDERPTPLTLGGAMIGFVFFLELLVELLVHGHGRALIRAGAE